MSWGPEDVLGRIADLELQERRRTLRQRVWAVVAVLVCCGAMALLGLQSSSDMVRIAEADRGPVRIHGLPASKRHAKETSYLCGTLTTSTTIVPVAIQVPGTIDIIVDGSATLRLQAQGEPCGAVK